MTIHKHIEESGLVNEHLDGGGDSIIPGEISGSYYEKLFTEVNNARQGIEDIIDNG